MIVKGKYAGHVIPVHDQDPAVEVFGQLIEKHEENLVVKKTDGTLVTHRKDQFYKNIDQKDLVPALFLNPPKPRNCAGVATPAGVKQVLLHLLYKELTALVLNQMPVMEVGSPGR